MKNCFNIGLVFFLTIMGCQTTRNLITKSPSDFQSLIACEQASVILTSNSNTGNSVKKYKRSQCPECKGKGYIMSGDGLFKQPCPYCEKDSSSQGKNSCGRVDCPCQDCKCVFNKCNCKTADECNKYSTVCDKPCCKDCICPGGRCNCKYPGECLVKRNGGRSVKVCDGKSCTIYSAPRGSSNATDSKTTITRSSGQGGCASGNCSSGGWGRSSRGGRRAGMGWF